MYSTKKKNIVHKKFTPSKESQTMLIGMDWNISSLQFYWNGLENRSAAVFQASYGLVCLKLMFEHWGKDGQKWPFCVWQFVFCSHHEQDWHVWQECILHHEPTFSCSLLVKSKPTWLHREELKFKAKKKKVCINVDRMKPAQNEWKHLHILYVFRSVCVFAWFTL